jgi:hypothetical protein
MNKLAYLVKIFETFICEVERRKAKLKVQSKNNAVTTQQLSGRPSYANLGA